MGASKSSTSMVTRSTFTITIYCLCKLKFEIFDDSLKKFNNIDPALMDAIYENTQTRNGIKVDWIFGQVMGLLLASGVGAGFGLTFEAQAFGSDVIKEFLYRAKVSTGMLLAGCVSMALLSILSSNRHTTTPIAKRTFF